MLRSGPSGPQNRLKAYMKFIPTFKLCAFLFSLSLIAGCKGDQADLNKTGPLEGPETNSPTFSFDEEINSNASFQSAKLQVNAASAIETDVENHTDPRFFFTEDYMLTTGYSLRSPRSNGFILPHSSEENLQAVKNYLKNGATVCYSHTSLLKEDDFTSLTTEDSPYYLLLTYDSEVDKTEVYNRTHSFSNLFIFSSHIEYKVNAKKFKVQIREDPNSDSKDNSSNRVSANEDLSYGNEDLSYGLDCWKSFDKTRAWDLKFTWGSLQRALAHLGELSSFSESSSTSSK